MNVGGIFLVLFTTADVVDQQMFDRMSESRERKKGREDKERIVKEMVISFISWIPNFFLFLVFLETLGFLNLMSRVCEKILFVTEFLVG